MQQEYMMESGVNLTYDNTLNKVSQKQMTASALSAKKVLESSILAFKSQESEHLPQSVLLDNRPRNIIDNGGENSSSVFEKPLAPFKYFLGALDHHIQGNYREMISSFHCHFDSSMRSFGDLEFQ